MKLAKRLLPLMMAVLLLASLLAACGGGNSGSGVANSEGTNTATSEPSGSTAEPDAKGSKTLTVLVEAAAPPIRWWRPLRMPSRSRQVLRLLLMLFPTLAFMTK